MAVDGAVPMPANPGAGVAADEQRLDKRLRRKSGEICRPIADGEKPVRPRSRILRAPDLKVLTPSKGRCQPLACPALKAERLEVGRVYPVNQHALLFCGDQVRPRGEPCQERRVKEVEHQAAASVKIGNSVGAAAPASTKFDTVTPTNRIPFAVGRTDRIRSSAAWSSPSRLVTAKGWLRRRVI